MISVHLSFGLSGRDEDYHESEMGLLADKVWSFDVGCDINPSDALGFFVFGHRADRESKQRARQSGGTLSTDERNTWDLTLSEVTDSWGLGLNTQFADGFDLGVTAQWSRSDGDTDFFTLPGGTPASATSFDEYDDNEWTTVNVKLGYAINKQIKTGFAYGYEEYTTNRFARDGLTNYAPGSILLNYNDGDYAANIFAAYLQISFGGS